MKFSLLVLALVSGLVTADEDPPADTASPVEAPSNPTATVFDESLITLNPDIDFNQPPQLHPATTTATQVTIYDYQNGIQTIHVCPTGQPNTLGKPQVYDCIEATCNEKGAVINVVLITITITIVEGNPTTVTVTKTGKPTMTPSALPESFASIATSTTKIIGTGYSYPAGTGTGSYPHEPTHHVSVGKSSLKFSPPIVHALTGDTIRFSFFPRNHTVTSSNFDTPCVANGVFDSGFHPTWFQNSTQYIDYPVTNASATLFFFSRQKNECKNGMVFAVNPTSNEQFKEFYTNAVGAPTSSTRSALSAASSTASSSASHSTLSTHTSAKSYATPIPKEKREGFVPREYKGPE